jgi:hypothetical protein
MVKSMKQQWKYLLIAIIAIAWIVIFPMWSNWVTEDPLDALISLNPAGKIEHAIDIRIPEKYELSLIFERAGQPFEKMKTLIGAMGLCKINEPCSKGIPVPIRWSLSDDKSGSSVVGGETISQNSNGWSKADVYRRVGSIQVKPGHYIFRAEIMRNVPELESIKSRLAIKLRPKSSETWQIGLVWWGAIATYIIMWPMMLFSIATIIWRILRPTNR